MKENRKMELTSYDEIFSTEESRQDTAREKVMEIPLSELYAFRDHPFKVQDDERMLDTAQSIREYGVLVPAIARPRKDHIKVHLTPQEHEWIKEKMAQAGMTNMSEFIRRMAMNGYVINADQPELDEILRLMHYTGNNLRQIEKHVRENEPEHMPEVEQLIRNHEEIEDALGEILRILGKLS